MRFEFAIRRDENHIGKRAFVQQGTEVFGQSAIGNFELRRTGLTRNVLGIRYHADLEHKQDHFKKWKKGIKIRN